MTQPPRHQIVLIITLTLTLSLAGCGNPYAPNASQGRRGQPDTAQNPGEPPAPPPAAGKAPVRVQSTPQRALSLFAALYTNWSYRTLAQDQQTLAAISVGAARLTERQAATASSTDTTIARARVFNHGQLIAIAEDLVHPGTWILVTHEQTGSEDHGEYEGLGARYHLTLAKVIAVPGGWAVSDWRPQT
jgi:hypothetical protein